KTSWDPQPANAPEFEANSPVGAMRGAGGYGRDASRLAAGKRRLLRAAALGALASSGALTGVDPVWGQISETLPEVTVSAPRSAPRPPRRAEPAARRAAPSAPERPEPAPAPVPSVSAPSPFQFVAPTPITGLGIDRSKVPAMVQTLPAEDFSRTYSPNVVETFVQRIPGVTTNDVQGNEFTTDLRYRGFAASRDLHLAADQQKPGGTDCAQRPLLRDRPLDGAEQSLLSPVRPAACRPQRRRGRALQRGCQQSAVQHTVPRKRCLPAAATAGGRLPDPQ